MMSVVALVYVFIGFSSPWYVTTSFLLFILLFLIAAAKWLEVPFIVTHLERWFERVSTTSTSLERSKETE